MSLSNEYITLLHYLKENLSCKKLSVKESIPLKIKEKIIVHKNISTGTCASTSLKEKVNKLTKVLAENFNDNIWQI